MKRKESKRKNYSEFVPNMSWLLSLVRPWLSYWGLSKSMARGKGIILTQSKWVFWPSVSLLALAFIDLHNICLKFLAPWVLPDPNEKPNSFPMEGACLEPFSGPFFFIFSNLCGASSIFLFLPQDRQGLQALKTLSFLSPLPISAYLLSTWLHLKMSCFNSPLTSVVSRDHTLVLLHGGDSSSASHKVLIRSPVALESNPLSRV